MSAITLAETFVAFALSIVGGLIGTLMERSHRRLCALISLGAGTLLGVTLFDILPETLRPLNWGMLVVALVSGYALFFVVTKYVFHVCPACAASHFDEATTHRFSEIALGMTIALAIHCVMDGLAIAAGHQSHGNVEQTRVVSISIVLAICVHKIPEGLALGSLLLGAGYTPGATLVRVIAVESTTVLGGVLGGLFLQNASEFWIAFALANAGGGFIYLAAHAVLGEILRHHKTLVLANFIGGMALIAVLTFALKSAFH
ncbi:MAG: zinc/iron permease [Verrucomicrobiales bacterium]|nr:zinc/iron permease [Verrucomicrobiales bacterium]